MFRRYLSVTKPGIIMGNLISVAGGFLLASRGDINPWLMVATLIGLSLVVASGCAINNVIDRDIDIAMARTRTRVTVTGEMSAMAALCHGVVLGIIGFGLLIAYTTPAAVFFAAFGYFIYVGVYSLYMKRNSVYGTFIGSLSGAVPPVVGYCAVSGEFDMGALILLVMFSLWQMPHSYAIAIFRFKDYQAAGIPVLPVAQGIDKAKRHIVLYIAIYALVVMLLPISGYTGAAFMAVACITSFWWLLMALRGYRRNIDISGWARQVFAFSIINITALSIAMAVDYQSIAPQLLVLS
ncbi:MULTISPECIES: heme o synthase [Pseudoalteromonas]|jgi:protoheme IX farnesyltransferase|uniref:Protoheme IX farnesyltransferase n=1 Tax=Pseudoalteromonas nigrifaciens TaxID=28109 RepID=A0AAC9UGL3_9GAMM|nr:MULTISPECIES: heme o synthase [Pseudoalteromonas]ASM54865.1 protoheme IX farnesyltransferase [Pseudoalteromonas nigrifaciens]MBB1371956.1 protoheme IX farnesyltransferase [Pseudoalteromonas sp. SR45-4]MBH0072950.1 protoheme IX farnesyltransferase [Pseudoalteromonas sp. NZS127]NYR13414.1 protoheme IX farnesyltransferase [Pseudoalteromonas sp. MIP2626]WMS93776.1 heme o synthase [Pseudoalteromonas sp. HL-AS2]|tara:strand:- start:8448 stop:9332 length:885 start_codon:yes stop_codon:yes gene_type:complete